MTCKNCGSYAINHHCHGRDGSEPRLCDVCFWRSIAERNHTRIKILMDAGDDCAGGGGCHVTDVDTKADWRRDSHISKLRPIQ